MSRARYVLCCGLFESFCLRLTNVVRKPVLIDAQLPGDWVCSLLVMEIDAKDTFQLD